MFCRLTAGRLQLPFPAQSPGPTPPDSTGTFPLPPGPQALCQHWFHMFFYLYVYSIKKNCLSVCVILSPVDLYNMLPGSRAHFTQGPSEKGLFFHEWEVSFDSLFYPSSLIPPWRKKCWIYSQKHVTYKDIYNHKYFVSIRWRSVDGDDRVCESCSSIKETNHSSGVKSNHKRALRSKTRHRQTGISSCTTHTVFSTEYCLY